MIATIIYLHGFASSGVSAKSDAIRAAFPNDTVLSPNLPFVPEQVIADITALVTNATDFPIIFVGTSLGGFWSNYFAHKFDAPAILINPSTNPSSTMLPRVGTAVKHYETGNDITVTTEDIAEFERLEVFISTEYNGALVDIFLAQDDDVIPFGDTILALRFARSIYVTPDGGHRYESNWPLVIAKIAETKARLAVI